MALLTSSSIHHPPAGSHWRITWTLYNIAHHSEVVKPLFVFPKPLGSEVVQSGFVVSTEWLVVPWVGDVGDHIEGMYWDGVPAFFTDILEKHCYNFETQKKLFNS